MTQPDVIVIGSGMGGATLASALAPSGRSILILERGQHLNPSLHDRDDQAIFGHGHFRPDEQWTDGSGTLFNPGNYYYVGGNTKFYGAVLIRFRAEDFSPLGHIGGISHGWPMSYEDLEPCYQQAETLYQVRGQIGQDPTEPPHSGTYSFLPVPDEPDIADLRRRLSDVGLHPASLPLGVDLDRWLAAGQTPWDAYPNTCGGKMDAETIGLAAALKYPDVSLLSDVLAVRLCADVPGRITGVEIDREGRREVLSAPIIILAAGAVQSAALLLRSADETRPEGLANRSGQVGRNFMNHNTSAVLAIHPLRRNRAVYQKTVMINDFYLSGGPDNMPLGSIQLLGKISGPILAANSSLPPFLATWIAGHSLDFYAMSEDLPNPDSRVTWRDGKIVLDWQRSNRQAHRALTKKLTNSLNEAGFPIVLSQAFDRRTPSHQCGTARMGEDPHSSVVDSYGRSHEFSNLFISDASVFPASAAVNPALTIAALSLRTAQHIMDSGFRI